MMRQARTRIGTIWAVAASVVWAFTAAAAHAEGPCAQIRAACRQAGFVQGGAKTGNGLQIDCIDPIIQGAAQRRKASRPLPQVDAQLVAACRARNPASGLRKAAPSETPPATESTLPTAPTVANGKGPNIVFVLTDDLAWNLVQYMPHVLEMQTQGVTFANYFVTDSLCCPSRSSIFTGRYPHDTGIFRNQGEDGGYLAFRDRGHEKATFATALSAAGYRTAMMGKYLNGYLPRRHPPAPGWTSWAVAGNGYPEFNYNLNQDGQIFHYGDKPTDYLTDVLSDLAVRFIKKAAGPFFVEIATFAPHAPYTPAPRDADALPGLLAPRTPAFNASLDANAPKWLLRHPSLSDSDVALIDRDFRKRGQSVLAVDAMLGELQKAVAAIGHEKDTYFVFSSDNGYHMGEYRLMPGKMTAYDTDIRVPLIVTGPGIAARRTVEEVVENVDLCPTFTELGNATAPSSVDGRSLVPLLQGEKGVEWRTVALVEHHGPLREPTDPDAPAMRSGNPTTYEAIRTPSYLYVEYADGEKEYHDLAKDPDELRNSFSALSSSERASLHVTLESDQGCHDAKGCWQAERPVGGATRK